jgi:hypothetical protein
MDTFWLKAAAVVIVIAGVIFGVTMFRRAGQQKPKEPPKTIYDMAEKDKKELLAAPSEKDFAKEQNAPAESTQQQGRAAPAEAPAEPTTLYFKEVSEIESIEAENILANIPSFRTIGRLPFTGYKAMVESCRRLMERFPGTIYDYKARRALSQVPQRYWQQYKITADEVDLEYFRTQRPDTKPYTVTED